MERKNAHGPMYVLPRNTKEMERLELQGRLLKPFTRRLFDAAGIRAGMKVLDVGCGAGDVAFLAAELVGSGGSVIGIDTNPIILETAQQRALVAGLSNVTFVAG